MVRYECRELSPGPGRITPESVKENRGNICTVSTMGNEEAE
jgi:hypothetical protein